MSSEKHGEGSRVRPPRGRDDTQFDESEAVRVGASVVGARVEPYAGMSASLVELLLAGYFTACEPEEATLRQQVVMAYRAAGESWSTAGSLVQLRRDWGKIFGRIEQAVKLTAFGSDIGVGRCRSELELVLLAQVHRLLLRMHHNISRKINATSRVSDKARIASAFRTRLKAERRSFESWFGRRSLVICSNPVVAGLEAFLAYWEARCGYHKTLASAQRCSQRRHRNRGRPRTSQRIGEFVLREAILKILRGQPGTRFTAAELIEKLIVVMPSIAEKTATRQRLLISQAVNQLRKEGHWIPPYKYQLLL